MFSNDPINKLHNALAHAQYEGFPEFEYEDRDWEHYRKTKEDKRIKKSRKHSSYDIIVFAMFTQTWGSTALGFGGLGGQAMTSDYVVILESEQAGYCVYFGGRFAYRIAKPNEQFLEDVIINRRMADVSVAKTRYEK